MSSSKRFAINAISTVSAAAVSLVATRTASEVAARALNLSKNSSGLYDVTASSKGRMVLATLLFSGIAMAGTGLYLVTGSLVDKFLTKKFKDEPEFIDDEI